MRNGIFPGFSPAAAVGTLMLLIGGSGVLTILSSQTDARLPFLLAGRQLGHLIFALVVLTITAKVDFSLFRRLAWPVAVVCCILIWALPFFGTRINGCCGWFRIGSWCLQPTEPGKAGFLLLLAVVLGEIRDRNWRFPVTALLTLLWLLPVYRQPDFGMCTVYIAGWLLICFLDGVPWKQLFAAVFCAVCTAVFFVWRHPYAWRRFSGFLCPEADPEGSGWHVRQFALTIARGGWTGTKLGQAVWSNSFLPLPYNDSALATMLETLGLLGTLVPVVLYAALIVYMIQLGNSPELSREARLFIHGSAFLTGFQALLHASVNLCLLPPTGLPLPLVSYGGSSLLGCGLLFGMVLSAANSDERGR